VRTIAADVAVIGAGPAGATTAMLLARAGFDVLLADRQRFPRAKPCGDCLSPEASRVLERLGVLERVLAAPHARLEGWRIVSGGGAAFEERFASVCGGDARVATALAIERVRLDAALLDGAVEAGTRVVAPLHVSGVRRDGTAMSLTARDAEGECAVRARIVVGADGLRSTIARRIGAVRRPPRLRKLSLTAHLEAGTAVAPLGEMHVGDGLCVGVAPVTAGRRPLCNVTVVADAGRFGRHAAADAGAFHASVLARFPALGHFAFTAPTGDPPPLASGPFDVATRRCVVDGVALVGDAAGYYDPFTGQGICHALTCAEILAGVLTTALRAGDVSARRLRSYALRRDRIVRPARVLQQAIDLILRRPGIADAVIRQLSSRRHAARAILAATGDLLPPGSLLSPLTLLSFAAPRWVERHS
jgi:flavin-dependent dehydrogenase